MWIRCLFGVHRRSRRHAHEEGPLFVSQCAGCGIPMEKTQSGRWIVRDKSERNGPGA